METNDYIASERLLRSRAPFLCWFAGRKRLSGVIDLTWLERCRSRATKYGDRDRLLGYVLYRLKLAYPYYPVKLILRPLARILIAHWNKDDG